MYQFCPQSVQALFFHLSIFTCQFIDILIHPLNYLFIHVFEHHVLPFISFSVCSSMCPCIHLTLFTSIHLSAQPFSLFSYHPFVYSDILCPSIFPFFFLFFNLSILSACPVSILVPGNCWDISLMCSVNFCVYHLKIGLKTQHSLTISLCMLLI